MERPIHTKFNTTNNTEGKYNYQQLSWSVHRIRYLPYKSNHYTVVFGMERPIYTKFDI